MLSRRKGEVWLGAMPPALPGARAPLVLRSCQNFVTIQFRGEKPFLEVERKNLSLDTQPEIKR